MNECVTNSISYSHNTESNTQDISKIQENFMKDEFNIDYGLNKKDILPHIEFSPKFHKPKLSQQLALSHPNI